MMTKKLRRLKSIVLASMAFVSFFATPHASAQVEKPACPPPFGQAGFFQLNDEGKIELSVKLDAPGLTKDQLYSSTKAWYLELIKEGLNRVRVGDRNLSARLTIDDMELGQLVSIGVPSPYYDSSRIPHPRFNLQILVRDGESEILISDLVVYYALTLGNTWVVDVMTAEKFFDVNKPQKRYRKKTGEMVKVRRLECEDLIDYGAKILQSYSEAIEQEKSAESE